MRENEEKNANSIDPLITELHIAGLKYMIDGLEDRYNLDPKDPDTIMVASSLAVGMVQSEIIRRSAASISGTLMAMLVEMKRDV